MRFKFFHKLLHTVLPLLLLHFSLCCYARQNASEDYFLPTFRAGHNLSLLLSGEMTTWNANQSTAPRTTGNLEDVTIDSAQQGKAIIAVLFRYAYHINIISGFGFFVGSTGGLFFSNGNYGRQQNFYPGYGISFPTVLGGLLQGIGQDFRILAGAEYGAVWFPQMKISSQSGIAYELSTVPDMYSFFLGMDSFLSRTSAITFNVGYRQIHNPCLSGCSTSVYSNSLSITSKSYFAQLGFTWSLSDFNLEF